MDQKVKRVNDHLNELLAQNRQQVAHTNLLDVRIRSTSDQTIFLAQFQIWGHGWAANGSPPVSPRLTFSLTSAVQPCRPLLGQRLSWYQPGDPLKVWTKLKSKLG